MIYINYTKLTDPYRYDISLYTCAVNNKDNYPNGTGLKWLKKERLKYLEAMPSYI